MLVGNGAITAVFVVGGFIALAAGWKIIDWITPGDLNKEILGSEMRKPNMALATVVAAMIIGISLIIASAIH